MRRAPNLLLVLSMATPSMPNPEPRYGAKPQQKIVVYITPWCPYCIRAKLFLKRKGWDFEEIDVDGDVEKRRWLREVTGMRTVPQIFIGEEPIGGFDDMSALDRRGGLDAKVLGTSPQK